MADHKNDPPFDEATRFDPQQARRIAKGFGGGQAIKTTLGQPPMRSRTPAPEAANLRGSGVMHQAPASPAPHGSVGAGLSARPLNLDDEIVGGTSVNLRLGAEDAKFLTAPTTLNPSPGPGSRSGNVNRQEAGPAKFLANSQVRSELIAANADPHLMEGSRIGNYEIIRKIGEGGMGVVYEGRHLLLPRRVAIKFLLTSKEHDEEQIRRFLGEAVAAAQIGHPGVVSIYDYGFDQRNAAYLVMEFIEGQTLQAVMKRSGQLPVPMALRVIRDVSDVLAAAHQSGIIHRDLKPENVILSRNEQGHDFVKVLDFGVAKFVDAQSMSGKTQAGSILGTPWYMPPEQCQGMLTVDYRSDIYALGCVFYQMVCGKVPFAGSLRDVLVAHITTDPVPPTKFNPSIPPRIEELILKMMAKEPTNRPISMEAVAHVLEEFVEPAPEHLRASRQSLAAMPQLENVSEQHGDGNPWIAPILAAVGAIIATAGVFYFLS